MKKCLLVLLALLVFNCSEDDTVDPTIFNENLSIIENLENGVPVLDITNTLGAEVLYGLEYGGGYIYHVDEIDGTLMVATNYSQIGTKSWGDHFDLTNGEAFGDGEFNTEQIVNGNLADNSNVPNGLEYGSDDYAFKIAYDLNYNAYDDWFIPSRQSIEAIFNNLHLQDIGNFDETLFYWTSSKAGYQPYVMSFDSNFGGETFLGSCFNSNAILLVRKI
ncbi:MAG: hypothetical protein HRU49_03845 [Winogradskyella sp.]|uniref:hypothetical protein n=1 Tax=Winogradskyella sp. TaxID=1883156 RepID=UPI0025D0A75D|nr:hypothetical protein [Winogradskyella sp.]NRB82895.1 hypothetical protein [Winogradskyella sp.]